MPGVFNGLDGEDDPRDQHGEEQEDFEDDAADGGEDGDLEDESDDEGADDEGQGSPAFGRQEEVAPRGGRATNAVRAAKERARHAEAERQRLHNENMELRRQAEANRPPPETDAQREARYAAMDPMERMEARYKDDIGAINQRMAQQQFQSADRADKSDFYAQTPKSLIAKHGATVEAMLHEARKAGTNYDRNVLLKYIIGEEVLKQGSKQGGKQRKEAQERVGKQTVRPPSSRSDRSDGGSRRGGLSEREARYERLKDLRI